MEREMKTHWRDKIEPDNLDQTLLRLVNARVENKRVRRWVWFDALGERPDTLSDSWIWD